MSDYTCPCCGQTVEPDSHSVHTYLNTVARGPERERAAVVKHLRRMAAESEFAWGHAWAVAANVIESGEHHK